MTNSSMPLVFYCNELKDPEALLAELWTFHSHAEGREFARRFADLGNMAVIHGPDRFTHLYVVATILHDVTSQDIDTFASVAVMKLQSIGARQAAQHVGYTCEEMIHAYE